MSEQYPQQPHQQPPKEKHTEATFWGRPTSRPPRVRRPGPG